VIVLCVVPLRVKNNVTCFAGALHGVPILQTGAVGLRITVPWRVPSKSVSADAKATIVAES
jgi:hypothetical protein